MSSAIDAAQDRSRSQPVLLSWSGGKDSALALARLRRNPAFEVVGLLTTVTAAYDRISIHGVRRSLLYDQAAALGIQVHEIILAPQCSNASYEAAWRHALKMLPTEMADARHIAFGDIFLADVRTYREDMARAAGYEALFPLWGEPTQSLAREVVAARFAARVVCVDTHVLDASFAGNPYDDAFLAALPESVDPCGERGEFHTFVSAGPGFHTAVRYELGDTVLRDDRFAYCDLIPHPYAALSR